MPLLHLNGTPTRVDADDDTPLLWVLRDHLGLTGTKFACGIGECGACTIHLDGQAVRACVVPLSAASGKQIRTIEAVAAGEGARIAKAWIAEQVPQCGYCQPGMIMAVSALLASNADPSDAEIDAAVTNLCRCGTQPRIRRAIQRAARARAAGSTKAADDATG
ncbi:MAG: (2Fe-2S)-binding protein [Myxococcota bacterium]